MKRTGGSLLAGALALASTLSQPFPVTFGGLLALAGGVVFACLVWGVAFYFWLTDVRGWGPRAK